MATPLPNNIHSLADEILAVVFSFAGRGGSDDLDPATTAPTSVSQVSQRWRSVALATGSLWKRIVITFPLSAGELRRALIWLARSGEHLLEIVLDLRDPDWDWDENENAHPCNTTSMSVILWLLLPHARRWRSVGLFTDNWVPLHAFLGGTRHLGDSLPQLETLHLARCNAYFALDGANFAPAALATPIPLFGGAALPRLRSIELAGVHIAWDAGSIFVNLTYLSLKYLAANVSPTRAELAAILRESPTLRSLVLVGCTRSDSDAMNAVAVVILPHLEYLHAGFVHAQRTSALLAMISIPNLVQLQIEDVGVALGFEHQDSRAIFEWLGPSMPTGLRELTLHGVHAPRRAFARLFAACRGLGTLVLRSVGAEAGHALQSGVLTSSCIVDIRD